MISGNDHGRLRLLLASSSVAALLIGGGAPAYAVVPCSPFSFNGVSNNGVNNAGAIVCIDIQNSTIGGGVTNAGTGVITAIGPGAPSKTGITIGNNSVVTGTVANSGNITASGNGIFITGNATVSGGVGNSGTIAAKADGIFIGGTAAPGATIAVPSFAGGIGNAGAISAASGNGIFIGGSAGANLGNNGFVRISTFSGGISNGGTISAHVNGILVGGTARAGSGATSAVTISNFSGGIANSGTISATGVSLQANGIFVGGFAQAGSGGSALVAISTFSGGISNGGTISSRRANGIFVGGTAQGGPSGTSSVVISNFSGGITNSGNIAANGTENGIIVGGRAVDASGTVSVLNFSGGISNSGTISAGHGIVVGGLASGSNVSLSISNFSGGISNGGNITARTGQGILVGGQARGPSSTTFVSISNFSGGITNNGTISAHNNGIFVGGSASGGSITISNFSGGVTNNGTISAIAGAGIWVGGFVSGGSIIISTFSGGVSNNGVISARNVGIFVGGSTNFGVVAISTFIGGVTNSGTISVSGFNGDGIIVQNVATFLGNVWNSGTIMAPRGTGIFVCNCATFAGGAIVNTGSISAIEGIAVHSFSAMSIFDSGTITGTVAAIDLTQASGGNTLTLGPGFSFPNNSPVLGFGNDTLQLGGSGNGSIDLSTVGTQITGFTTFNVISGTWTASNIFGQTQGWTVMGGTLAGTGTLPAINVLSPGGVNPDGGGTLEPGTIGQPGTFMTVTGNLTFQPGATYLVNIGPTTASRANVGGTAFLNGVVAGVLAPGSYNTATTYDILSAATISGTFASFTAVNAPGFGGTLAVVGDPEVTLKLTAQLGSGGGLNANQQNVATSINNDFNTGGTLPANFFPLFTLSGGNLASALTRLDGEAATGAQTSAFQSMNEFLNLMLDPSSVGGGSSGGAPLGFAPEQASVPPEVALAYASLLKAPPLPTSDHRWTTWGAAYGGSSLTDGNAAIGSNNITASDYGFAGGMEYHLDPSTLAGFALAGGGTNWNLANALGSGRSDTFQAGLYGKHYFGPAYVSGALAFANNWFTTSRTAFAGDQLTASFDGQSYAARLEGGYRYALPAPGAGAIVGVTPYAALQTQWFHTPSYSETDLTGGGFGLSYNAMTANDTRSELGARFDDLTMLYGMPLILRGRLAWAHDWVDNPSLDAAFQVLPGTNFIVFGAAPPKDSALTTAGAELHINANWSLLGKFDGDFASGAQTYSGSGTLRYTW